MRPISQLRWIAAMLIATFTGTVVAAPLAAAGTMTVPVAAQVVQLTTKQKVILLAGAAALYWLYKRHQNAKGVGANGKYYRSRNGRVYFRDARTRKAIWIDPPPTSRPVQVTPEEYRRYVGSLPPGYDPNADNNQVLTAPPGPAGQ